MTQKMKAIKKTATRAQSAISEDEEEGVDEDSSINWTGSYGNEHGREQDWIAFFPGAKLEQLLPVDETG